jgi:hypothetical protein
MILLRSPFIRRKRWTTGVKRIGRKTYKVVKSGGAWLIYHAGRLVALFVKGAMHTFSREVGKTLAKRVLAAR